LQFSKIKRLANFFLSHNDLAQISRTYASVDLASVGCSLSQLSENIQWSSHPEMKAGAAYL